MHPRGPPPHKQQEVLRGWGECSPTPPPPSQSVAEQTSGQGSLVTLWCQPHSQGPCSPEWLHLPSRLSWAPQNTKAKSPRCRAGITPPRASRSLGITRHSPHWGTKPHPRSQREQVRPPGDWTPGPRGPIWKDTPPAPGCAAAGPRQGLTRSLQGWGLRKDLRLSQRQGEQSLLPLGSGTASTSRQAAPACPPLAQVRTPSGARVTAQSL